MWRRFGNKYGNRKVVVDGRKEDSKGQARRHKELEFLQEQGIIRNLDRQVTYRLYGRGGNEICKLIVDFTYFEGNQAIAEDFKGVATPDFIIKKKLFEDNYPGVLFRLTGPYEKIMAKKRAKARAKYAAKKMAAGEVTEKLLV